VTVASDQRVKGGADLVITQKVQGRAAASCPSTGRAQCPRRPIRSRRIIRGWGR